MKQIVATPQEAARIVETCRVVKRSVDARQHNLKVLLTVLEDSDTFADTLPAILQPQTSLTKEAIVVGSGPAGLFAALTLLHHGIKPIIIERGKEVAERKRDIALLNRNEGLNPESNYCFGEGGAGTFSDGKLFSRSKKRGAMQQVMEVFHYFGADSRILYETHAHIGSDKLPAIIAAMRRFIIDHGGEFHFSETWHPALAAVPASLQQQHPVILAIGHSAHDTYRELAAAGVAMEAKGCAMGVRIEHPQALINDIFYHHPSAETVALLGAASYSLVTQVDGRGVYSFCMCPGGHIVPAASNPEQGVVNGMSASHRNSPYANSGMVVSIPFSGDAMQALDYQEHLEHQSWLEAGNNALTQYRPAQRMTDFVEGKASINLPPCSYLPGIVPSRLDQWLPEEIGKRLQQGLAFFGSKHKGFLTHEAVLVGVESRTSSPIRITRDPLTLTSVSHPYIYPCGEGAGYAGGITSSALDGILAATALAQRYEQ